MKDCYDHPNLFVLALALISKRVIIWMVLNGAYKRHACIYLFFIPNKYMDFIVRCSLNFNMTTQTKEILKK